MQTKIPPPPKWKEGRSGLRRIPRVKPCQEVAGEGLLLGADLPVEAPLAVSVAQDTVLGDAGEETPGEGAHRRIHGDRPGSDADDGRLRLDEARDHGIEGRELRLRLRGREGVEELRIPLGTPAVALVAVAEDPFQHPEPGVVIGQDGHVIA